MNETKYTLNRFYLDQFGKLRNIRVTMRAYKNRGLAERKADAIKGGYICELGSNNVLQMGSWAL